MKRKSALIALKLAYHLKDQLQRAASSCALNIIEGSAKASRREQRRFYETAYASIRESKAALMLADQEGSELFQLADRVAAMSYRLMQSTMK